jgi:hypothetical protein
MNEQSIVSYGEKRTKRGEGDEKEKPLFPTLYLFFFSLRMREDRGDERNEREKPKLRQGEMVYI